MDIKADTTAATDRGESLAMMEPMLIGEGSRHRGALTDLAVDLAARSAGFRRSLPEGVRTALADLVRSMNCYYSNLIEGHDTHPVDIERALRDDYSADRRKRELQLEAKAHIEVQRWIDKGELKGRAVTSDAVREVHRRFCELLPDELLWVEDPDTHERSRVTPGELRRRDVRVGQHVPMSPGAVPRFLAQLERAYSGRGKTDAILAVAAAHHRLLWIHPFLDGNGRVARLMSHAMFNRLGVGSSLWAVSRGLARNVDEYKALLMAADRPRENDYDGRGNLSERALFDFCKFFLRVS